MVRAITHLGVECQVDDDNGQGSIIVAMDDVADTAVLGLWDELSDLRVRYIEAKQESAAKQLSYLEGQG